MAEFEFPWEYRIQSHQPVVLLYPKGGKFLDIVWLILRRRFPFNLAGFPSRDLHRATARSSGVASEGNTTSLLERYSASDPP